MAAPTETTTLNSLGKALQRRSLEAQQTTKPVVEAVKQQLAKVKKQAKEVQEYVVSIVKDPSFQTMTVSTAGGAITVGAAGGAFGTATGVVIGGAAGLVPALLTFGLSIPAGALIGGASGMLIGSTIGGGAGGATGLTLYKYRVEIKDGLLYVKVKALDTAYAAGGKFQMVVTTAKETANSAYSGTQSKLSAALDSAKITILETTGKTKQKALEAANFAKTRAAEVVETATTTRAGVTSTAAAAGGTVGGVAGGAVGVLAGAAVGIVPAVFTFGLSIPVGATIGLCAGAAAGGGVGVVGGGVAGFTGFTYRKEIQASANYIKTKAYDSAQHVSQSVKSLVGAGTGGTS